MCRFSGSLFCVSALESLLHYYSMMFLVLGDPGYHGIVFSAALQSHKADRETPASTKNVCLIYFIKIISDKTYISTKMTWNYMTTGE